MSPAGKSAALAASVFLVTTGSSSAPSNLPVKLSVRSADGLVVEVAIENETAEQLDVPISSAFILGRSSGRESFWAPFHPTTGKPIPLARRPPRLRLGPRESQRLAIPLRALKWAQVISSVWPFDSLDAVVPPGHYPLVWELSTEDHSQTLRTNEVTVEVLRR